MTTLATGGLPFAPLLRSNSNLFNFILRSVSQSPRPPPQTHSRRVGSAVDSSFFLHLQMDHLPTTADLCRLAQWLAFSFCQSQPIPLSHRPNKRRH